MPSPSLPPSSPRRLSASEVRDIISRAKALVKVMSLPDLQAAIWEMESQKDHDPENPAYVAARKELMQRYGEGPAASS